VRLNQVHIQEQQASDIDWKIHEEYVLAEMVVPPGKVSRPASIIIAAMITQHAVSKATEENAGRRVYYWRRSPGRAGIGAYENARPVRSGAGAGGGVQRESGGSA